MKNSIKILNMKKHNNRKTANLGKDDFLVVHEGLQNHYDIQQEVNEYIKDLQEMLESNGHLSDSGLGFTFLADKIEKTAQKCFLRHKEEQKLTLEQFNNLYPLE